MSLPGIGSASAVRHFGAPKALAKYWVSWITYPFAKLHDAHGVAGHPVVRDDALAPPKIPAADDPEDGEVSIGWVCVALRGSLVIESISHPEWYSQG